MTQDAYVIKLNRGFLKGFLGGEILLATDINEAKLFSNKFEAASICNKLHERRYCLFQVVPVKYHYKLEVWEL